MKKYKITACVNGVKKSRIVKVKNEVDAYLIGRGLSAVIDEDIDMFNELLADSESTQKAIDFWRDRRFRKQAEAEKIKAEQQNHKDFLLPIMEAREDIKAEAIKESAERVKDICRPCPMYDDYERNTIYEKDIDNLVKEMVGDSNA